MLSTLCGEVGRRGGGVEESKDLIFLWALFASQEKCVHEATTQSMPAKYLVPALSRDFQLHGK